MAWKIGDISSRTGLTARTLHFYEEQGLIGPVSRNAAGHRLYGRNDLLRLQHIKTLRALGLPLSEMKPLLDDAGRLLPQLRQQLLHLSRQRESIQNIEARISRLIDELESSAAPSDDLDELIFQTLESMSMYEKYFNQTEINAMHSHSHDETGNSEEAWNRWLEQMQAAFADGADPQSAKVQALMGHWHEMVAHITGNDADRLQAWNDLFHNEPQARKDHGISDELFAFMAKAAGGH